MLGKGTITATLGIAPGDADDAQAALQAAGFAVTRDATTDSEIVLSAGDTYSTDSPDAELQREHVARASRVLDDLGVRYRPAGVGVVKEGGTAAHRWVDLVLAATGAPVALAIDRAEAAAKRDEIAADLGLTPDALAVRWED